MPQEIPDPPSDLQARAEKVLTDFLSRDLDLAFTFLQTPEVETGIDRARHSAAIQKARSISFPHNPCSNLMFFARPFETVTKGLGSTVSSAAPPRTH